jgi:GH25 family lysozyme M1 (1,4-beta-N-acetylmuramidase)
MFAKRLKSRKLVVFFSGALILFLSTLATVTAHAQRPLGIDVSSFQSNNVNWASVKSGGYTFAWAKATEGVSIADEDFTVNEGNAKSAGVPIGAYDFAHPEDNTPSAEANHFWGVAGNYVKADGKSLMPMLDYETFPGTVVGANTYADWANLWCSNVVALAAAAGVVVKPVIYISACNTTELSSEDNWTIPWIANYNGDAASSGNPWEGTTCSEDEIWGSGTWDIWQYSSSVTVPGVSTGPCDVDVFNGTSSSLISTLLIGTIELTTQMTNVTVNAGDTAALNVNAGGSGSLSYQWQFEKANIAGATNSTYTITNAQLANAGPYSVLITNSVGSISASTFLSVIGPLVNAPGAALDPSNIVNWWTGDGNTYDIYGVTNLTPNGYLTYTNGKVGLAFRLDGSSAYMTSSGGEITPPWTVCAWIYHQRAPTASAALAGDTTYALKVEQWSNTDEVGISQSGVADYLFSPAYTLPLNTWTHLALVATSSSVTLYANGVEKGTVSASDFELPRGFFGVDTFSGNPADYMLGAVDEFQIFNRALAASEIASIYNAGSAGLVRAPEFTSVTNLGNGQIQVNLIGQTAKTIGIQSSPDLVNWSDSGKVQNPTGATTDTISTASSPEFFKAYQKY